MFVAVSCAGDTVQQTYSQRSPTIRGRGLPNQVASAGPCVITLGTLRLSIASLYSCIPYLYIPRSRRDSEIAMNTRQPPDHYGHGLPSRGSVVSIREAIASIRGKQPVSQLRIVPRDPDSIPPVRISQLGQARQLLGTCHMLFSGF